MTWISDKSNAITFGTRSIETNARAKAAFCETFLSEDSFRFGFLGACIGVVVGFFKGCSIANGSVDRGVLFLWCLICGFMGVVIGIILRAWAERD